MVRTNYICETCGLTYQKGEDAFGCEAQGIRGGFDGINVGDIVVQYHRSEDTPHRFGWQDGDPRWVAARLPADPSRADHFRHIETLSFFYVVTAIDSRGHVTRHHIRTKAMAKGYLGGWTRADTHTKIVKVDSPPAFVVEDSKDLIGQWSEALL